MKPICFECIKKDLHCCNKMPLFNNFEITKLLKDEIHKKLKLDNIVVHRYMNNTEIFTILRKGETFKNYEKGNTACIFFDKEKGCLLTKEYRPTYCKTYMEKNPVFYCPFIDMDIEKFKDTDKEKLLLEKIKKTNIISNDIYFSKIFKDFFCRFKKSKKNKKIKIIRDELIFALVLHALNLNAKELKEENILEKKEKEIIDIENKNVVFYKIIAFSPLIDNIYIREYARKINYLYDKVLNSKSADEIDILIQKTESIVKGIDNFLFKDEDFEKNFAGFLFANSLLYQYKNHYKLKHKKFKGLIINNNMLESAEEIILNKLENRGIDIIEYIEKINDYANKFFRRIVKAKL